MPSHAMQRFFESMRAQGLMLTYDDVRLRPGYSEVLPADADLSTRFSRNIKLPNPIVSSPMDTVTEADMAIAMAEHGCLGVVHNACSPEAQVKGIKRVKYRLHGRIMTPVTVRSDMTVRDVLAMRAERKFDFHTFPVLDRDQRFFGLLTRTDFDFCSDFDQPVSAIMTPVSEVKTACPDISLDEAFLLMRGAKKRVLPLVSLQGELKGMYLFSDLERIQRGNAGHALDRNNQLLAAAAVGVGADALKRADALSKHCNVFVINTAHGDSQNVISTLRTLKREYPHIDVVAGNVSSGESAVHLAHEGADGVIVGQGPGSICTTRIIAGIGVPQVSAVWECVQALAAGGFTDVPVCADGGISNSGDMVIALAVGASTVMLGRLLAGTKESPGETTFYEGRRVKAYRGMGSLAAMRESAASRARYQQTSKLVPEGVEGIVPYQGPVSDILHQYLGGIRAGLGYIGARTISELAERAEVFRISPAGLAESHPHDIIITAEPANYRR